MLICDWSHPCGFHNVQFRWVKKGVILILCISLNVGVGALAVCHTCDAAALIPEPSAGRRRWGLRSRRSTWVPSCCLITRWGTQSLIPVDIHWPAREPLWLCWMAWAKKTALCAVVALRSSLSSASLVLLCPLCCQEYCSYSRYPW